TYQVALRVTTDLGACSSMTVKSVVVDPLPNAGITPDVTSGCSILTVNFSNDEVNNQPLPVDRYVWEVDEGAGFVIDSVQRPGDPGFSAVYTRQFVNTGTTNEVVLMRLRVISTNGCEQVSTPETITIFPGPESGFISTNYSPFNDNCSPQSVDFEVDNATQSLNPTDYTWIVSDNTGMLDQVSTGTTPSFSYQFINATQAIRTFNVTLRTTLPSTCYGDSTRTIR